MLWFEVTARVAPADVEGVAALMREISPGGVAVEEPITILGPEMGFRVREGEPVFVRAYVPSSELGAVLTEQLRRDMQEHYPAVELRARALYEEDWAVSWREFFGPVDYGGRIVVVPTWVEYEAAPGQIPIALDPGQAFGTGHHETTRLCLGALERYVTSGSGVLDVGTGSGVLAIAAVKLGAARVTAIDVDPVAIRVATENCEANGVLGSVELAKGTLEPDHAGRYEIVVANISAGANLPLLPTFAKIVGAGGHVILSGILAGDAAPFRAAAPALGLEMVEVSVERDWCLLVFARKYAA